MVGLEVARCAAFGAVGVVRAAGCRGPCAVGGQRGAAEVVAVQVEEVAARLDRGCAGRRRCSGRKGSSVRSPTIGVRAALYTAGRRFMTNNRLASKFLPISTLLVAPLLPSSSPYPLVVRMDPLQGRSRARNGYRLWKWILRSGKCRLDQLAPGRRQQDR